MTLVFDPTDKKHNKGGSPPAKMPQVHHPPRQKPTAPKKPPAKKGG